MEFAYYTIRDIQNVNAKAGGHWFDAGTLRYFKCRLPDRIYPCEGGAYFVTSEKYRDAPRLYSVRFADLSGHVHTVGEFQAYRTSATATKHARKLAAEYVTTDEDREALAEMRRVEAERQANHERFRARMIAKLAKS